MDFDVNNISQRKNFIKANKNSVGKYFYSLLDKRTYKLVDTGKGTDLVPLGSLDTEGENPPSEGDLGFEQTEYQKEILTLCQEIAEEDWGIENDYEAVLISSDGFIQVDPTEIFNTSNVTTVARHHQTHAAAAFYLSPFKQALIVSYDGGGDDGHFNVYAANGKEIKLLKNIKSDFGGGYLLCGSMIREVAEKSKHQLALSGKLMGLCGYGKTNYDMVPAFEEFFFDRDYEKLSNWTNLPLKNVKNPWKNPLDNWVFEGQDGYDIAATAQAGFEDAFFSVLDKYDTEIPLIITGGCALTVLVNEKVKQY